MVEIRKNISRKKDEVYDMLRPPTLEEIVPNLIHIGREVFNMKEKVGYADDVHALFTLFDDEKFRFIGFAGDKVSDKSLMQIGDKLWIVDDEESYNVYLNPIEHSHNEFVDCESVFQSEWFENVSFGESHLYDGYLFISCYKMYELFMVACSRMNRERDD